MLINRYFLRAIAIAVPLLLPVIQPAGAQTSGSSESDRLQKLERAVEQLQKRNAELEREVSSLKKQSTSEPAARGKTKTVVTYDGKIAYETERWSVALIGKNLADRRYFVPFPVGNGMIAPAEPRTVYAVARVKY